jgi:branched-chain amino acid transport system substrate-binding protein
MKMKRLSLIALLSLLMSLALIACTATPAEDTGGGSEEVMATEAAPAEEAPAEEAPAEEPMEEVACTDAIGCVEIASGDPILLASALSISGDTADLGTDSQRGVEIAIAERGELFGRPLSWPRKMMAATPKAARRRPRRSSPTRRLSA